MAVLLRYAIFMSDVMNATPDVPTSVSSRRICAGAAALSISSRLENALNVSLIR